MVTGPWRGSIVSLAKRLFKRFAIGLPVSMTLIDSPAAFSIRGLRKG